ncbi:sulfite oxidase [Dyadobacter sp.]|uniref:sulfite oxidase n=1 Tax=Dyadobacter sp. TaxID=1914288 RepID=UPI003F71CECF
MTNKSPNRAENKMHRRAFLSGVVPAMAGTTLFPFAPTPLIEKDDAFPGLITREKEPSNLEFPFATLKGRITPNARFFVRSHFPFPKLDSNVWKLSITGDVKRTITITYDELRKMPSKTVMATLECAGNGRAKLAPKVKGLLWEQGAVGNAEWTGVPLSALLEKAGLNSDVLEIILEGADKGEITEEPRSPGEIHFARSISLKKALEANVLIAYQMNGKDLPIAHGYPVRAIIPGWYGMASIKWLTNIIATSKPFEGYWQTIEYAYWKRQANQPTLTAVTAVEAKAEIARPMLHEVVAAGKPYRVHGAAWCGEKSVIKVEISTDNGLSWQDVKLLDKEIANVWRLWEFNWQVPSKPSTAGILVRATDSDGHVQPDKHDPDRRTYMVNKTVAMEVEIG